METLWKDVYQQIFEEAEAVHASDVHLAADQPVFFRIQGQLQPAFAQVLTACMLEDALGMMLDKEAYAAYQREGSRDFSWSLGRQRFRVNAYCQRGHPALALRRIPCRVPRLVELGCPQIMQELLQTRNGLILVSGRTGAGKTTTLAAFLDELNHQRAIHIVTLEDPLEYLLTPACAFISQRELGKDFSSFASGLRSALRQDPDVLLIGELRDAETVRIAMQAAETGILVLSSLHTKSAAETAMRLEGMFSAEEQLQVRAQLAVVLRAVISQQLLPAREQGRVCAAEVLLATPAVRNLIRSGKPAQLNSVLLGWTRLGMQTMEQAVEKLYRLGKISAETASAYRIEDG